jgi:hypothetical protein
VNAIMQECMNVKKLREYYNVKKFRESSIKNPVSRVIIYK